MTVFVLDTSFLAHALVSTQMTEAAADALQEIVRTGDERIVPLPMVVEFGSLLRKSVTQGRITGPEARAVYFEMLDIAESVSPPQEVLRRGYELAEELGQSDTFDSTGYALAEAFDGEFWTSDRRFANAAANAGMTRVRLSP